MIFYPKKGGAKGHVSLLFREAVHDSKFMYLESNCPLFRLEKGQTVLEGWVPSKIEVIGALRYLLVTDPGELHSVHGCFQK